MVDEATDDKWVGKWFTPELGQRYTVPNTAGNHNGWKGKVGVCIDLRTSSFGMAWALLTEEEDGSEDGEVRDLQEGWVRTCYLTPLD